MRLPSRQKTVTLKQKQTAAAVCFCLRMSVAAAVLCAVNAVELVAGAHLAWHFERYAVALVYTLHLLKIHPGVVKRHVNSAGSWPGNKNLVAGIYFPGFNVELAYS